MPGLVGIMLMVASTVAAQEQPSGTVTLYITSAALGVGAQWGNGTLTLNNGKQYRFAIQGLEVGGLGFAEARATGKVYNLQDVSEFAGLYVAAEANAAAGQGGPGVRTMRNQHGAVMHLSSTVEGLKLTLAGEGVRIALKE
jgi:hypothetical protein